jgi:truncated hemoglobin YjbI
VYVVIGRTRKPSQFGYPRPAAAHKIASLSIAQQGLWGSAMSHRQWTRQPFLLACFGLFLAMAARAEGPADKSALDRQLSDALRDMHNRAADLFNVTKDYNGAYRMFQGGLYVVRPLLNHRQDAQQVLDQGMQEAERLASLPDRAMRLHKTIEDIRAKLRPPGEAKPQEPKPAIGITPPTNPPPPATNPPAPAAAVTLWARLGGEERVKKIVDQFVTLVIDDPNIDFKRRGKYKFNTKEEEDALKAKLVAFISDASGGPIRYTGKSMAEAHKDMAITAQQFDTLAASLRVALKNNAIADADVEELMKKVEATKPDIVGK